MYLDVMVFLNKYKYCSLSTSCYICNICLMCSCQHGWAAL